ncbi:permease [Candidatus Dependentiae bacterium]|nr:permease [Candidatus Dependentiae bacterium]
METYIGILIFVFIIFSQFKYYKRIDFQSKVIKVVFAIFLCISLLIIVPLLFEKFKYSFSAFCKQCPLYGEGIKSGLPFTEYLKYFFSGIFFYFITIIPFIIVFSVVAAFLKKLRIKSFKNPFISFFYASIIPVCSCGIFPLIYSLENKNKMQTFSKLIFFLATPLLSPIIIIIGIKQLGGHYVLARFIYSFVFVFLAAGIIMLFLNFLREKQEPENMVFKCSQDFPGTDINALNNSINLTSELLPAVGLGILIGTLTIILLPADYVNIFFNTNKLGIFLISILGIPIYLCGGSDILILTPLVVMGLPVSYSLAFSTTGAGICFGSIPLLFKMVKWKFALLILILYIILPPLLGILLHLIWPEIPLIDRGF